MGVVVSVLKFVWTFPCNMYGYVSGGIRKICGYVAPFLCFVYWILDKLKCAFDFVFIRVETATGITLTACRWLSLCLTGACNSAGANLTGCWTSLTRRCESENMPVILQRLFYCLGLFVAPAVELWYVIWNSWFDLFLGAVMYVFWYFFESPLMLMSSNLVTFIETVDVIVLGLEGLANFFTGIANAIIVVINGLMPIYLIVVGTSSKLLASFISEALADSGNVIGGQARFLKENNLLGEVDSGFGIAQSVISSSVTTFASGINVFFQASFLLYRLLGGLIIDLFGLLQHWIESLSTPVTSGSRKLADGSQVATPICCLASFADSPPSFAAPFCCVRSAFRNFFLTALAFDIGLCKTTDLPPSTLCKCSAVYGGPFDIRQSCVPPYYQCVSDKGIWSESRVVQVSMGGDVTQFPVARGTNRQKVCKHFINAEANAQQVAGNLLNFAGRSLSDCGDQYCVKSHGDSWLFQECGNQTILLGTCIGSRRLEGELWKQHLKKFNSLPRQAPISPLPPPEEPLEDLVTGSQLMQRIKILESQNFKSIKLDCPNTWAEDLDFLTLTWRAACVIMKVVASNSFPEFRKGTGGGTHRILRFANLTAHEFMDQVVHLHNDMMPPERHLVADFHKRHLETMDMVEKSKEEIRRMLEGFKVKSRKVKERKLIDIPDKYSCPGGQYVDLDQLSNCPFPTNWTTLTTTKYAFYTFASLQYELDINYLFQGVVECYALYTTNTEKDPTLIGNIFDLALGKKQPSDFTYCFPLFPPIPFIPPLTWSFKAWAKSDLCAAPIGSTSPCDCKDYYTTKSLYDYKQPWTSVSREYIRERIWNSWKIIQLGITIVLGWLIDPIWQTIWTILFFLYPTPQLIYAFNKEFVTGGMTEKNYSFCAAINIGSFVWFFIFVIWPFIVFFKSYPPPDVDEDEVEGSEKTKPVKKKLPPSYAKWLYRWAFKIQYNLLYIPMAELFSRLTLSHALRKLRKLKQDGHLVQRDIIQTIRRELQEETVERERIQRGINTTILDTSQLTRLLRRNVQREISPEEAFD